MSDDDSIDLDEIIAVIAKKNKIIINETDPLLAVSTINDYLMNHYLERSNEALSAFTSDIEKIHQLVSHQANENVNKIINASLRASKNLIEENTKKSIESINKKIREQIEEEVKPLNSALKTSNCLLLFSSFLLVGAAILIAVKI